MWPDEFPSCGSVVHSKRKLILDVNFVVDTTTWSGEGKMRKGISPNIVTAETNALTKTDIEQEKESEGNTFVANSHIPPYKSEEPNRELPNDKDINSLDILFENKATECEDPNQNDPHLKNSESTIVGTKYLELPLDKKESTAVAIGDVEKHHSVASSNSSSNEILTDEGKLWASNETFTGSTLSNSSTSSSIIHDPCENDDTVSMLLTSENNLICENASKKLSSSDLKTLPDKNETAPNLFFPKGKLHGHNLQVNETGENTEVAKIETETPAERYNFITVNKKYIQKDGYRLGINPGTFYSSTEGYFVEVPNGINYEIILTNENPVPCNVDVFIDNRQIPAICFQLNPGKPVKFDGPTFCKNKFTFLRSRDAPAQAKINPVNTNNGIVQAIFTPQKAQTVRARTVSEPTYFSPGFCNALQILGVEGKTSRKLRSYTSSNANAMRGIDITHFCQGASALRGEQTTKMYKVADSMEVDEARRVVITLRLIARTDDPTVPCEEDICSMYPPSVELLKS